MANMFRGKSILITGGSGSIGSEIARKILQYEPKVVRVFSNDEDGLFNLEQELRSYSNVRYLVGDVRDEERLRMAVENMDLLFHTAALKHVPFCEYNPFEAVKTNVIGTQNVIEVARREEVEKLISISTDKAVNPVNVMGATKLLCERLTVSANKYSRQTKFSCVRFGNVLDSRGSVVPLFKEQIRRGGPVTITDPDMTRFVMTILKAAELVLKAAEMAKGGEIFIFKMPALRIGDLAEAMIEELASRYGHNPEKIRIELTGKRPGEKGYEELMTEEETKHAYETENMFIVLPEKQNYEAHKAQVNKYISENTNLLTKEEIKAMLRENFTLESLR